MTTREQENKLTNFVNMMHRKLVIKNERPDWENHKDRGVIMAELWDLETELLRAMEKKDHKLVKDLIAKCSNQLLFLANSYAMV